VAAETSNPSQITEVAEAAWEPITSTIKAKILWSDPATKRRAQLWRCIDRKAPGSKRVLLVPTSVSIA
jgi:hypothetical protein